MYDRELSRLTHQVITLLFVIFLIVMLGACSVSSLRCGTDGDSSFVDLTNVPQDISSQSRYFGELCAFAFEEQEQK